MAEVKQSAEMAEIKIGDKNFSFPMVTGTENEKAIDISELRTRAGLVTYDDGYANTASCLSRITYIDGEKGILRYRGIPVEDLAGKCRFIEVAYLLIFGHLPTTQEREHFSQLLTSNCMIHDNMVKLFDNLPSSSHPMATLSAMVVTLSAYYPELAKPEMGIDEVNKIIAELLAKIRTLAAYSYKKSIGEPIIYPKRKYKYVENFLHMMFSTPVDEYVLDREVIDAVEKILILHADHEQNCSTSAVRLVGSSKANLFASISAGICALWGPLHGGANQAVIEMLEAIVRDGGDVGKVITKAKDKQDSFRLMGFGHRIYKNFDPRARVIKGICDKLLNKLGLNDPCLEVAKKIEEAALKDDFFIQRKLYPNVDFYSGIVLRAIGIPTNMFTVIFAMGRLPGWIAHWKEQCENPKMKIGRPRQIYIGAPLNHLT
ncbi:MAG TPA: citrate synthase [Candidatus Omnitrophota bacterium]|nr:citrate synthase [Candidatus Omnitrophota bacterium]